MHNSEPTFYYHTDHLGSTSYLTDQDNNPTQTISYLPFGEDWVDNIFYYATGYPLLGIYSYNGKEKDYESGFHYYGARYYNSELSVWLSTDPMADKYPSLTPYNYCANNPVILVDPDGRDIWITGEEQKKAFKSFKDGVSKYGIKSYLSSEGKVSARYVGKGEISEQGQYILDAINSTDVHVNIIATNQDKVDGKTFIGGAFMGNSLKQRKVGKDDYINQYDVYTRQVVNPIVLSKMDDYTNTPGANMLHEVFESYLGGLKALEIKNSLNPAFKNIESDYKMYLNIHNATPFKQTCTPKLRLYDKNNHITNDIYKATCSEYYLGSGSKRVILQTMGK